MTHNSPQLLKTIQLRRECMEAGDEDSAEWIRGLLIAHLKCTSVAGLKAHALVLELAMENTIKEGA